MQITEVPFNLKQYYHQCKEEHKYNGFVADLYCQNKNNIDSPIFIEIKVTHECSEAKKASGIRIIEITIRSEEDILNIIQSNQLIEGKNVQLYNFKKKELIGDNYKIPFHKFILYPSTKVYIDTATYTCQNYNTHRKGIFEISLPLEASLLYTTTNGGLYKIGKTLAYNKGLLKNDCYLCKWVAQDIDGQHICKLYKRCRTSKYCEDNNSSTCSYFKADSKEIDNILKIFNNNIKQACPIDIWKRNQECL